MDEKHHKLLMRTAIMLTLAWIGWTLYDARLEEEKPGAHELAAAGKYLEDGQYTDALDSFETAHSLDPDNTGILRGKAQTHMRLGNQQAFEANRLRQQGNITQADVVSQKARAAYSQALTHYNMAIDREYQSDINDSNKTALGVSLANRGILKDQIGDYAGALSDYQAAMALEPKVIEGPGLLTRFMRNQAEQPPTVADRARYLQSELAKPMNERLLSVPLQDEKQRAYKLD